MRLHHTHTVCEDAHHDLMLTTTATSSLRVNPRLCSVKTTRFQTFVSLFVLIKNLSYTRIYFDKSYFVTYCIGSGISSSVLSSLVVSQDM